MRPNWAGGLPVTLAILVGLFVVQRKGAGFIGGIFGPVMLLWFVMLAISGVAGIAQTPGVLAAMQPAYAVSFLLHAAPAVSFAVLGAVFLAVTGGEQCTPIWVISAAGRSARLVHRGAAESLLNYLGQGALLLADPGALANPFYQLAPTGLIMAWSPSRPWLR